MTDPVAKDLIGYLPGTTSEGPLEENVDAIPGQDDGNGPGNGLVLERHIHFILRDQPELWEMCDRFWKGEFDRGETWGFTTEQLDRYSAFEVDIVTTITGVLTRKRSKAIKDRTK